MLFCSVCHLEFIFPVSSSQCEGFFPNEPLRSYLVVHEHFSFNDFASTIFLYFCCFQKKKKICKNKWANGDWPRIKIFCQKSFDFSACIFAKCDVSEVSVNSRTCPAVGRLWLWSSPIRASLLVTCPALSLSLLPNYLWSCFYFSKFISLPTPF